MLKVSTFGGLVLEQDGSRLTGFMSRKAEALFVYLVCHPQPHPREPLATLFWSEIPNEQALANLRLVLFSLKKQLGVYLDISRQFIAFNPASPFWFDVHEFKEVVAAITRYEKQPRLPYTFSKQLEQALSLYRGSFLAGINLQNADGFEDWLSLERERFQLAAIAGLRSFLNDLVNRGQYTKGIDVALRLIGLDPYDDAARATLMTLLAYDGRTSTALTQFENYRRFLEHELNIQPDSSLQQLCTEIQNGSVKPPTSIRFLQLPVSSTTFVNRPNEMVQIAERLDRPDCRLLTLTGVGGVGKTRLALQMADEYATSFANGVCFISFVPVTRKDFIVPAIAKALNLDAQSDIFKFLGDKEILFIFDNFEHLLDNADIVAELLQSAPQIKFLITSREPLNILEEWVIQIGEMSYPTEFNGDTVLERYNAIQLFSQTASRVRADFDLQSERQTIIRICKAVQGLPLAIEIAAAWTRILSYEQIASKIEQDIGFLNTPMRNIPTRHQSIYSLFDHSWNMLSEHEQSIMMRLAVFQDTFNLEAASLIAGVSKDVLSLLIDKALVRPHKDRYDMHELIKRYAHKHLEAAHLDTDAYISLVDYYLEKVPSWHEQGLAGAITAELLDPEIGNLRGILGWLVNTRDLEKLLRVCDVLDFFWGERGFRNEGRYWLAQALDLCDENTPKHLQALALANAGSHAWGLSDLEEAQVLLERALTLYRELDNKAGQLRPLMYLGHTAMHKGDYAQASMCYHDLQTLARGENNTISLVNALISLGAAKVAMCDYEVATRCFEEAYEISLQTGEKSHLGFVAEYRGIIAFRQKEYPLARSFFEQRLEFARQIGSKPGILSALISLGEINIYLGNYREARIHFRDAYAHEAITDYQWDYIALLESLAHLGQRETNFSLAVSLFAAADKIRDGLKLPREPVNQEMYLEHLNALRNDTSLAVFDSSWQRGQCLSLGEALNLAMQQLG